MYYVKHTGQYPIALTAQVDHYPPGKIMGFNYKNAIKIIAAGMGSQPPKPKGVECVDVGVSSTAISVPARAAAKAAAPKASPKSGDAGNGHDPGKVQIPGDWETTHHLRVIQIAKQIDPDAPVKSKADAEAVIQAELERRGAA